MTVHQTEADEAYALTVFSLSKIIVDTGKYDTVVKLMAELLKHLKTQAESMPQLTKMITMFLEKSPAGEPTRGSDKDLHRGRGG